MYVGLIEINCIRPIHPCTCSVRRPEREGGQRLFELSFAARVDVHQAEIRDPTRSFRCRECCFSMIEDFSLGFSY
jgi:hypothetical protein